MVVCCGCVGCVECVGSGVPVSNNLNCQPS